MGGALEKGVVGVVLLIFLIRVDKVVDATKWDSLIRMPSAYADEELNGTRWAILVAGSYGFGNYRHQADVCHAYQILKKGGLKDENIVVFMYDDIASNPANPHPGTIINHPQGEDVYAGVLKDYTGGNVNVNNFYAVLLGNRSSINGGSGKVIDSGPNDHIFIYYSDHGGPGVLGMPTPPYLYAIDFVEALKKKHASGTYKEMVIYVEACESGSIFEGLLPNDLNIYVTTAANAEETSWGTYCLGMTPSPPAEYQTCLGDLYSVAWMEDSEAHNLKKETLLQQYELVRSRTSNHNIYSSGSHVMQYGDLAMNKEHLYLYMGFDPANVNETPSEENILDLFPNDDTAKAVNQREADLLYLWHKFKRAKEDSPEKLEAQRHIVDLMQHRMHLDRSLKLIGKLLFGSHRGANMFKEIRPAGQPIVDDWNCLKTMVRTFESHCGFLSQYGMKYMRAVGNICNAGVTAETMAEASSAACGSTIYTPHGLLNSLKGGFSA